MRNNNLDVAERVAALMASHGSPCLVIGAVALAAHRYVRHTEDIEQIRETCLRYRLRGLDKVLEELG